MNEQGEMSYETMEDLQRLSEIDPELDEVGLFVIHIAYSS